MYLKTDKIVFSYVVKEKLYTFDAWAGTFYFNLIYWQVDILPSVLILFFSL